MADTFTPDWRSPPGDTIRDVMRARGLTEDSLRAPLYLSSDGVHALLAGEMRISFDLAGRLAEWSGASVQFWLRRDEHYREPLTTPTPPAAPGEE